MFGEKRNASVFSKQEQFEDNPDMNSISQAHSLFFAPESEGKDFSAVLSDVQEYISENYSTLITGNRADSKAQMKRYITKYLQDHRISVNSMGGDALADACAAGQNNNDLILVTEIHNDYLLIVSDSV